MAHEYIYIHERSIYLYNRKTDLCIRGLYMRKRCVYVYYRKILQPMSIYRYIRDLYTYTIERSIYASEIHTCVRDVYTYITLVAHEYVHIRDLYTYIIERSICTSEMYTCMRDVYTYIIERSCSP